MRVPTPVFAAGPLLSPPFPPAMAPRTLAMLARHRAATPGEPQVRRNWNTQGLTLTV
jgi:hypothetical protein